MARLPLPRRDLLSPDDQSIWDEVWKTRTPSSGPQTAFMFIPKLAVRIAEAGDYLRFHGLLPGVDRELAILTAGREVEARYEWQAHEPIAKTEGVREAAIEAVRAKGSLESLTPREQAVIELVRALYREHRLSDDLYARALAEFGKDQLIELVALAGQYGMIGFALNAFEVDLPASAGPTF